MNINLEKETYIMAPSIIASKARKLAEVGLYKQALDLLQRNVVEYDIYPHRVEVKTANSNHLNKRKGR